MMQQRQFVIFANSLLNPNLHIIPIKFIISILVKNLNRKEIMIRIQYSI